MEPRKEKFHKEKKQRLRHYLIAAIVVVIAVAATTGVLLAAKNHQKQIKQRQSEQYAMDSKRKAQSQSRAKQRARSQSQKAAKKTSKVVTKPKAKPAETALTFDTTALTTNAQKVGYEIYYYNSKRSVGSNQDQPFISASVIKLFIMDYLYDQVKQGKISGGHYIDNHSVDEWIQLMIQQSDNNATNLLIDFAGMTEINQYIQQQGYTQTKLERKMLDDAARNQGLDNYTSVKDVLQFLNLLYQNRDQAPYSKMLTIMKGQQTRTKIPSQLPANTVVANKTGELADVENDVGIVFKDNDPFAIVVLTNQVQNPAAERQAIGALSLAAFQK
ncbi:serine hydrolase [Latilactobacillus sakei]|uniref:serine hydrolase n=1 Tax=Latilactobacillus sakei TaxID=1599 RepID=UPI0038851030